LCQQACQNFSYSTYQLQNNFSNSSCCFSDSIDDVVRSSSQCGDISCSKLANLNSISNWPIFLVLGLICLLGNFVVIFDKIFNLQKTHNKGKEIQIYYILVLNLALADLLMGVYLIAISLDIKRKVENEVYFTEPGLCNGLAIINAVSSQVSLTILLIISLYRLTSVVRPFKHPHFRSVITLTVLSWVFWIIIAFLPIIPLENFQIVFTLGLVKNFQFDRDTLLDFPYIVSHLQNEILPTFENITEVKSVLRAVTSFPTPTWKSF